MIDPNTEHQNCGNCKFSRLVGGPKKDAQMICRRFPPKMTTYLVGQNLDGSFQYTHHIAAPPIQATMWCGEWKPKLAS